MCVKTFAQIKEVSTSLVKIIKMKPLLVTVIVIVLILMVMSTGRIEIKVLLL